jgi:hypothetical protein
MANQPQQTNRLSDEQVERLVLAIENLKDTNAIAGVIWHALQKNPPALESQRRVLVTSFAQTFELMTVMNMVVESKVKPVEFKTRLRETRARTNAANS